MRVGLNESPPTRNFTSPIFPHFLTSNVDTPKFFNVIPFNVSDDHTYFQRKLVSGKWKDGKYVCLMYFPSNGSFVVMSHPTWINHKSATRCLQRCPMTHRGLALYPSRRHTKIWRLREALSSINVLVKVRCNCWAELYNPHSPMHC